MKKRLFLLLMLCFGFAISLNVYAQNEEKDISLADFLQLNSEEQIVLVTRSQQGTLNPEKIKLFDYEKFKILAEKIIMQEDTRYTSPMLSESYLIKVLDINSQSESAVYIGASDEILSCYFEVGTEMINVFELDYQVKYTFGNKKDKNTLNDLWLESKNAEEIAPEGVYKGVQILVDNYEPIISSGKWSLSIVFDALCMGIVPKDMDKNFSLPITREEFCNIAYNLIARTTDLPVQLDTNVFTDTSNDKVKFLNQIGIIEGKSTSKFAPNEYLTRQEAATILYRITNHMNITNDFTISSYEYEDHEEIAVWAIESVYAMYKNEIMFGVGNDYFAPTGTYTKDQAIATIIRLNKLIEKFIDL